MKSVLSAMHTTKIADTDVRSRRCFLGGMFFLLLLLSAQVSRVNAQESLKGDWAIKCCNDTLGWALTITNQDGNSFSGFFSVNDSGGYVTNGLVRGSTIEFDRSGGGWKQHWVAQLINDGAGLRMISGTWSGDYMDRFPGQNNWHAEKKAGGSDGGESFDLTGLWQDDVGGRYRIRQVRETLGWFDDRGPVVLNVFWGTISGNTIDGRWLDLPAGQLMSSGSISLRIESNDKLVKVSSSILYGGSVITRVRGNQVPPVQPPPGGLCADPRTLAVMDEWLSRANPPYNQQPGWDVRYDSWGRLVGRTPTSTITGLPPGVDTRLTRCEYLWSEAANLTSTNLGTLKAYVEQRVR